MLSISSCRPGLLAKICDNGGFIRRRRRGQGIQGVVTGGIVGIDLTNRSEPDKITGTTYVVDESEAGSNEQDIMMKGAVIT